MTDAPPLPVQVAIRPKSNADWRKFFAALSQLASDDPFLGVEADHGTGGAILRGASESVLGSAIDRLTRIGLVEVDIGAPQVAYRERLTKKVESDYTHKKQTGGARQFARVIITFEPNEPGAGNSFETKIVGGSVPMEYIPGVEKGFNSVMGSGVLAGFPVVDLKATLIDAASRDVDSSVLAFELASRAATREALQKGGSVLLEPIMKIEVVTPEEYAGFIIGDLNSRRGQILGQEMRANVVVLNATAPFANMFGYVNQLRSGTQGRASYTMQFSHYTPLPPPNDDKPFRPAMAMRA